MIFLNETTTIRVSKKTAENIENLREKLGAESLDETIQSLVKKQRKAILEKSFGKDHNRIKPFSEADRGEDRNYLLYAWIEHFIGSQKGCKAERILENADDVYTPDIVLAEVARKYAREGIDKEIIEERLIQIEEASEIVCIDAELAAVSAACFLEIEENAKKSRLSSPGLFDAIILATGKTLGAKILTGDQHFKGLPETIWPK